MWTFIGDILIYVAGFVTCIYTWPWIRTKLMGAKAEVDRLQARIQAIADAAKPK